MIKGWKTFRIYGEIDKLMCDIAIFGEKSIVVDDIQAQAMAGFFKTKKEEIT